MLVLVGTLGNDFYPRPPRGGRLTVTGIYVMSDGISIHALREEGDRAQLISGDVFDRISIHALREEGDAGRYY